MAGDLTYLALGDVAPPEEGAAIFCRRRSAPKAGALYRARIAAVQAAADAGARVVCWVDGGGDAWSPEWPSIRAELLQRMAATGAAVGYCDETIRGEPSPAGEWSPERARTAPQHIHHGVLCRVDALLAMDWPAGAYHWETLAHHRLAAQGFVYVPRTGYDWRPTVGGAHTWADTQRAVVNSLLHLQGRPGVHFAADLED